jgi:hypothetical protein
VHGENPKKEPACGVALPEAAFSGYLCFMERYSTMVLPWSGEQNICHGFEEKYRQMKGRPRKARLHPSFRVIVGTAPYASKPSKIR